MIRSMGTSAAAHRRGLQKEPSRTMQFTKRAAPRVIAPRRVFTFLGTKSSLTASAGHRRLPEDDACTCVSPASYKFSRFSTKSVPNLSPRKIVTRFRKSDDNLTEFLAPRPSQPVSLHPGAMLNGEESGTLAPSVVLDKKLETETSINPLEHSVGSEQNAHRPPPSDEIVCSSNEVINEPIDGRFTAPRQTSGENQSPRTVATETIATAGAGKGLAPSLERNVPTEPLGPNSSHHLEEDEPLNYRKIFYDDSCHKWYQHQVYEVNENKEARRSIIRTKSVQLPPRAHKVKGRKTIDFQKMMPTAMIVPYNNSSRSLWDIDVTDPLRMELYKRKMPIIPGYFQEHIYIFGKLPFRNNPRAH